MKKTFIGLLLVAAAVAGVYYFLLMKKNNTPAAINKELAIGKWKIDSLVAQKDSTKDGLALLLFAMDSTARNHIYDFQTNGRVLVSLPSDSSAKKDTSSFAWGKENELLWKEKYTDSTAESMKVIKLDKEIFIIQSEYSTLVYFRKVK